MPSQVLRVKKSPTLHRRPKQKLRTPNEFSLIGHFWGHNSAKRIGVWLRSKLLAFAGLLLLVWLLSYLLNAPEFRVNAITVKGSDLLRGEDIIQMSGLRNQPVLLANTKGATQAILQAKPIKAARVQLEFPNRASIEVVERKPAYVWKVKDTLYLVSDDGIVLGTTPNVSMPLALVDVDNKDIAVGDQVDAEAPKTALALEELLPKEVGLKPAYFEFSRNEGVVLPTDFAGRVVFGNSEDLEYKVATLKALRRTFQQQKLTPKYVDLRFKDRAFFR